MLRLQVGMLVGDALSMLGSKDMRPQKVEKRLSGDFQDPSVQQLESYLH